MSFSMHKMVGLDLAIDKSSPLIKMCTYTQDNVCLGISATTAAALIPGESIYVIKIVTNKLTLYQT